MIDGFELMNKKTISKTIGGSLKNKTKRTVKYKTPDRYLHPLRSVKML